MKNIKWHDGHIAYDDRCGLLGQKGCVFWFTGLSGAGKSTVAVEVEKKLFSMGKAVYRLDGDNVRHGLNADLGFSEEDRNENIRRVAEVAALFKDAGIITLVSFISPLKYHRAVAREKVGEEFFEIYVKADFDICCSRDPKGLYKKALAGEIDSFTGVSAPYEEPDCPEVVLETEYEPLGVCVEKTIMLMKKNKII